MITLTSSFRFMVGDDDLCLELDTFLKEIMKFQFNSIIKTKMIKNYFLSVFFFSDEGDRPLDLCGWESLEGCSSLTPLKICSLLFFA